MKRQKTVMAIHDISCVGKCSLTVALPILSAAGIETSVLPTSLLSTHTGGFEGYTFLDLTGDLPRILAHWAKLGITFDAIYSGYLGSRAQIAMVESIFATFGQGALKMVDPVMGDNGRLYGGFSPEFPPEMLHLCTKADVLVPNFTEATLMLGVPYQEPPYTKAYVERLMDRLSEHCPGKIVLTGVMLDPDHLGAAVMEGPGGLVEYASNPIIPGYYHGTGDVFASALLAALLSDKSLRDSAQIAADFTARSIALSDPQRERRYGVRFEAALPELMKALDLV